MAEAVGKGGSNRLVAPFSGAGRGEPEAGSPVPSPGREARRRAGRGAAAGAVTATPLGTPGRPSVYAESGDAQARGKDLQTAVLK